MTKHLKTFKNMQFQNTHAGITTIPNILKALQVHSGPHFLTCGYH